MLAFLAVKDIKICASFDTFAGIVDEIEEVHGREPGNTCMNGSCAFKR